MKARVKNLRDRVNLGKKASTGFIPRLLLMLPLAVSLASTVAPAHGQINLPVLGNSISGTISTQQEYEFGREFLRSARRQTPTLNDPLIEAYISSVSYKLAATSELTDHRLEFILIDSSVLNAFAAPGGIVGVNAGLFLFAENEGEFASVIAHELAHISQRHYARNIEQSRNNAPLNIAGMLATLVLAGTVGGDAGQAALMTSQTIGLENQLSFSRSNEEEADRIGIRNLYNAQFDPQDMSEMFEHMMRAKSFSRRLPEFLSTHPLDENRIADSKNRANSYPVVDHVQNMEFLLMRQRVLIHYSNNLEAEIDSRQRALLQLNGMEADAARYGIAVAQLNSEQTVQATESLSVLLDKEPNRITYVMLNADIARAEENYDKALGILEENLRINPNNHALTMAHSNTLTAAGRFEDAARVLDKHSESYPNDMQLWYDLAEIQGQAGNIVDVHQARAEYFITVGEFTRAREQLNLALAQIRDPLPVARIRQRLAYIQEIQNKFYR